jgi:ketosteroid isomerase-like protein
MPRSVIFATAQDAEAAFYEALERADLDAMMRVWAEDEDIICVHPGGARLVGYTLIRSVWQHIFNNDYKFVYRVTQKNVVATPFAVVSSVVLHVSTRNNDTMRAPLAATNVFARGPMGWRIVAHHSSVLPPNSVGEEAKTLH